MIQHYVPVPLDVIGPYLIQVGVLILLGNLGCVIHCSAVVHDIRIQRAPLEPSQTGDEDGLRICEHRQQWSPGVAELIDAEQLLSRCAQRTRADLVPETPDEALLR